MRLHDWLLTEGVSASEFAAAAGFSAATVSRWLSGDRSPSLRACKAIARATRGRVTADDFMGSQDDE